MDKENENIKITEKDLDYIEKEFSHTSKPVPLNELTKTLAFQKKSDQLNQEVKKYDPNCQYKIGDFIYKEYDEPLIVSSKGTEYFKGSVVLNVVNKVAYESFDCEMLEVDYTGGGKFRKYIEYMKKTNTQVLIPSNQGGKEKIPEKMNKEEDPRYERLPMAERDLKKLERNLQSALSKSNKFFCWDYYWQLNSKKIEIKEDKINEIEKHITNTNQSVFTSKLVIEILGVNETDDLFELYCMSLNSILDSTYKKDFLYVSPEEWGKWHLKKLIDSMLKDLPLAAAKAKVPSLDVEEKAEKAQVKDFPDKLYLSWREIHSGGIKIPKRFNKELSKSREYIFKEVESGKEFTLYFFPSYSFFLGLKEFFQNNNTPQGISLTLEKKELNRFDFWLKKSKKKMSVVQVDYLKKEDKFVDTGKEIFTYAVPNKIIYLEKDTLNKLFPLYDKRNNLDIRELLILIYKNIGIESQNYSIHYLRAYHLVDMLKRTTQEDVEKTLVHSPEFQKLEKNKGIFSYKEKVIVEEEMEPEIPEEIPAEQPPEEKPVEITPEIREQADQVPETFSPEIEEKKIEEERTVELQEQPKEEEMEQEIPEEIKPEKAEKERKERISKKKRLRMEGKIPDSSRKGSKKFIEEQIELEESEQEAFIAVKSKDEESAEEAKKETKKKKYKPTVKKEPVFGIFAEKLKTALDKKKEEPDNKEKE